jgi:hypothetical protein
LKDCTDVWIFKKDATKKLKAIYFNFCGTDWSLQVGSLMKYRLNKKLNVPNISEIGNYQSKWLQQT